ncbi:ATP-binding protein [Sagittula sp. S175]|uniref:ATP-binding protein n=1 Tax=Sagittula sp. S175 TaxID=3415129 RepID=UPI003C7A80D6
MRGASLVIRLGLLVGGLICVVWLGAALVTSRLLFHEVNEVFDRDLRAAAERILPIVLHEIDDEDERVDPSRLGRSKDLRRMAAREDDVEFAVWSDARGLILRSAGAANIDFPGAEGFAADDTWRFYVDRAWRGDVSVAVARPLAARRALEGKVTTALIAPLLVVVPLMLLGLWLAVRRGLRPLGALQTEMEARGPTNLAPLPEDDLPREVRPMVAAANRLMTRIDAAFEAERSFAANAAHEMRTPVAGAIAQAQRLRAETQDPQARARATDIEATLKRLNRLTEKLMQMARAEGARLRVPDRTDLRDVAGLVAMDLQRSVPSAQIDLSLPDTPVTNDLDPDAFGIVMRNLVENALRHGTPGHPVRVVLTEDHVLTVENDGPVIDREDLARLSQRFMRGGGAGDGAGLGLSIVHVIAERSGARFEITSPRDGHEDGVRVTFTF